MRLALNVGFLAKKFETDQVARMAKAAGFDSADYSLESMINVDDAFNGVEGLRLAETIGKTMAKEGCPVTQTHAPFNFKDAFKDPKVYQEFVYPAIVRSIEISAAMGAKTTIVHPLHYSVYEGHEEEWFEKNMEFYKSLIPVCRNNGIKVCLENMFQRDARRGHITHDTCSTPEEFCRYVDTLNSEYMVACLDVGHVGLPPQKIEAWDFIRILGHDRLQALHIHDNDYKNDNHILPYTGLLDWNQITQALGEIDYTGDFTYEVSITKFVGTMDAEFYPVALRYMGDVGKHLVDIVEQNRPKKA